MQVIQHGMVLHTSEGKGILMKSGYYLLWLLAVVIATPLGAATGYRNHITIVGSSTAFPIVTTAAERFGKNTRMPAPVVLSMGTGGGFKLFCSGGGLEAPDITMASRRIKQSEVQRCAENGIESIVEIKIGYDGIVFASSNHSQLFHFRGSDLYLALAREVPDPDGKTVLVKNPYQHWDEINPALPKIPIRVYGPPPTSGTRDILAERLMDNSCRKYFFMREMESANPEEYRDRCHTLREDGAYINAGESDIRVVRKLIDDPGALGILGYNYLDQNRDSLQAATINAISPEYEVIENNSYPLSRPLYIYINRNRANVIVGLNDFLLELTSQASWGEDGYLVDKGLIPLKADEVNHWRCKIAMMNASDISGCDQAR